MPKISPFEKHAEQYERWFVKNSLVYKAELRAVKAMLPSKGDGVEIGVGTGRFAEPLGIKIGVEPSKRMREIAQKRGIHVLDGVAERLPFNDYAFDFVLMVTTICFVDDIERSLLEAYRILSSGGILVIGFVDRDSMVGKMYAGRQNENLFYKEATFFSVDGLVGHMNRAGFVDLTLNQTIFGMLSEITNDEPVKPGHGEGSFVVIRGRKEESKGDGNPEEEQGAHEKNELLNQKKAFSQKDPEKMGLLKRFLAWIAKGAAESGQGKRYCPT